MTKWQQHVTDVQARVHAMHAAGNWLLDKARRRWPDLGFTIIVHSSAPSSAELLAAVSTTLPSRALMRGVLTHCVLQALLADGATPDNVADLAAAEFDLFERDHAP